MGRSCQASVRDFVKSWASAADDHEGVTFALISIRLNGVQYGEKTTVLLPQGGSEKTPSSEDLSHKTSSADGSARAMSKGTPFVLTSISSGEAAFQTRGTANGGASEGSDLEKGV